jgi:hypothetical protein
MSVSALRPLHLPDGAFAASIGKKIGLHHQGGAGFAVVAGHGHQYENAATDQAS